MREMRLARTSLLLFLLLPFAAFAAEQIDTSKDYKGSADVCVEEVITLTKEGKLVGKQTLNEACKKAACDTAKWRAGQCQCAFQRIVDEDGKGLEKPVSKCDPAAAKKLESSAEALRDRALSLAALEYLRKDITPGTSQGDERITRALENLGVPTEQAQQVVREDPNKAYELLQKIAGGENEAAKQIATELKLNADIGDKIATLKPADLPDVLNGAVSKESADNLRSLGPIVTGFDQTRDTPRGPNIVAAAQDICERIPGGCGNACATNPGRLVCQTNNPGAIVCSAIATRFGATGCHSNNNTAIFPTVEHGAAAMASLLSTNSRYFASGDKSILQALCSGYSTSNCREYAFFVSKYTGIPINQTIDPKDTAGLARIMTAMSRFENGNGTIFTPQQLQSGLEYAFGTKELPAGTPGYTPSLTYGGAPNTGYYSPFALGYGRGTPSGVFFTPTSVGTPTGGSSPSGSSGQVSTGGPVSTGGQVPTQGPGTQSAAPALPQPVATLIAQPQNVARGGDVVVSWSSVGMSAATPCTLTSATSSRAVLIEQANEGTKKLTLREPGTYTFALRCTNPAGTLVEKSVQVQVQ